MEDKRHFWRMFRCIGICFGGSLVLLGCFVWLIDPFYHYHRPLFNIPVVLDTAVYQTAGAAKNLEYDSAIVGTSMTENMHTSWFDEEMGWNTMKLSYSGARSNDLKAIFEKISQKEGSLEHVFMDINAYQLTVESWTSYVERPEYLYDDHLFNDYQYLYNHDVLVRSAQRCLDGLLNVKDNIDTAYTWEEDSLFGKAIALQDSRGIREALLGDRNLPMEEVYQVTGELSGELEDKLKVCQENLDNILPFIEENPNTEFHIMLPPYSMLYWEQEVLKGELEDTIAIFVYAVEKLLVYDNVKIYYFQNEEEIITNLDNYRDSTHHRPEYNRYIFECVRDGKNMLTEENYKDEFTEMYYFAKDFPYNVLWDE